MRKKIKNMFMFIFLSTLFCLIIYILLFSFIAFRILNEKNDFEQNVYFKNSKEQIKSEMMIQGGLLNR